MAGMSRGGKRVNRKKKKPKVNPLDVQVDSAIVSQSTPYAEAIKQAQRQYGAEKTGLANIGAATQAELDGISQSVRDRQATALGAAATQQTYDADKYKRNLDFLSGVLGGSVTDMGALQGVGQVGNQENLVANTRTASELALGGQSQQRDFGSMRSSEAMRVGDAVRGREGARSETVKGYRSQIAAIKANRANLRRQMQRENLGDSILRQELGLKKGEQAFNQAQALRELKENQRQFDGSLAAGADEGAVAAADAADKARADQEKATAKEMEKWRKLAASTNSSLWKKGKAPKQPFRTSLNTLINKGMPPAMAAQWAVKWTEGNPGTYGTPGNGKERMAKQKALIKIMVDAGVSSAEARRLLASVYKPEYAGTGGGAASYIQV